MIAANTIIGGRYRVVKPLGGGGMKMVYLAEDLRLAARPCALAEMVDSFTSPATQQQAVTAFQREADMLATLSNEHIPRVFDRFSDENHHYLVMEYIEGITLEDKLRIAGGKLPEAEVVEVSLQVCDTLVYLHHLSPPVIYRDLKPSNVMLSAQGQAKLIDFGIARHFQPTQNATMIGTQGYAPPEQYRGKVDVRSDIYALGATMHHAISGRDPAAEPPFSFPPLRSVAPFVTAALAELIDQALQYDSTLRPADATEFKMRLTRIAAGEVTPPDLGAAAQIALADSAANAQNSARPQLRLPLSSAASKAASASAPTMLTDLADIGCPRCGRQIPGDSRYCSFCAADLHYELRPEHVAPDARTADLPSIGSPAELPPPPFRRLRRGRGMPFYIATLIAFSVFGFMLTGIFRYFSAAPSDAPVPAAAPVNPIPIPDFGAPPDAAQMQLLRQELNNDGYSAVQFRLDGDTLILWGTVPSELDRANVRWIVLRVTGIVSMVDHIQTRDAFAMP